MSSLGTMTVNFAANTSNLMGGIGGAQRALAGLADMKPIAAVGAGLLAVGAIAVGFGVASVKSAADFQESMGKVGAYANLSKDATDALGSSIMSLATSMGQSPKAMADALYPIISSGYSAAQSLDILKLSAETAAASGADMSVIANALTTSLKAMGAPASQAGQYMDDINKIVSLGKGQVSDYAAIIGRLSLSAKSANIPFGDMGAALADLTTHGFPSVAQASTSLSNLFTQIGPKVDILAGHAKKLGIAFDENTFKTDSLSQKLAYLQQVTGGNQGELLKLLGGSKVALQAFNALEGSTGDLAKNMKAMGDATGMTSLVFQKTHDDWNNSVKRLSATYEVIKDKVGLFLIGALTPMLNLITPLIGAFSDWMSSATGLGAALAPLGVIFAPLIATIKSFDWTGFSYAFTQIGAAISSILAPVSSLGGAFKGLDLKGIGTAIQIGFLQVMFKVADVLNLVAPALLALKPVFNEVGSIIGGVFSQHLKTASTLAQDLGKWFNTSLMPAVKQALPGFMDLGKTIMTTLVPSMVKLWAIGESISDKVMPPLVKMFEVAAPVVVRLAGFIAEGLSMAIKFLAPYVLQAAAAVAQFAGEIATRVLPIVTQFFNNIGKGLDFLQANWKYIWPSLSQILKGTWDVIVGIVKIAWALVSGIIKIGLDILSGNWGQAWNDLKDMLGGIWAGIQSIIHGQIEVISGVFTGLASMAIGWGQNLIGGFISGIESMFGSIGSTMSNLVGYIASFLPQSPAKQGELSHLNDYGPALMKGISQGIIHSKPMITEAMNMTLSPFALLTPHAYIIAAAGGSSGVSRGGGKSGQPVNEFHIYLDGREMAPLMGERIVQHMRLKTGVR